ncbi:MAG: aminopeptidase P family N-terminal domain-containing protein, partial [Nannocystaceae bacterium]
MRRRQLWTGAGALVACASMTACAAGRGSGPTPRRSTAPTIADDGEWAALQGLCDGIDPPDDAEREGHRERARAALHEAEHGWLVLEPSATMAYLSGVRWGRSERPFLLALPRAGEPVWVVPAFEERTAREQLGDAARVRSWQEHDSPYAILAEEIASRSDASGTVAVEPEMRHFVVEGLTEVLGRERVVDGAALVQGLRMRKQPAELQRLRRANEATKAALAMVFAAGLPDGIRQSELAERVRGAQRAAG